MTHPTQAEQECRKAFEEWAKREFDWDLPHDAAEDSENMWLGWEGCWGVRSPHTAARGTETLVDREKKLKALGQALWEDTQEDWVLEVSAILTEPTCPQAVIRKEHGNSTHYLVFRDTIDEAIDATINLAYREKVLGAAIRTEAPFTNSDDRKALGKPHD